MKLRTLFHSLLRSLLHPGVGLLVRKLNADNQRLYTLP